MPVSAWSQEKEKTALPDSLPKYEVFLKKTSVYLDLWQKLMIPEFFRLKSEKKYLPAYMRGAKGVHQWEEERYMKALQSVPQNYLSEIQWGARHNISLEEGPPIAETRNGKQVVYGFHPFWMGNAYYNYYFKLLTRIGYFSYAVDPSTGRSRSPFMAHSWRNSALHQKAHDAGCKVDLVVTNFGAKNNALLLGPAGETARHTLIDSLIYLLNMEVVTPADTFYRGNGITLDFEGMPDDAAVRRGLTGFIKQLKKRAEASRKGSPVSIQLVLPIWSPAQAYEFDSLKKYVDLFIICGYDYYLGGRRIAGPSSVLVADSSQHHYSVDYSVNAYLGQGLPATQTILSLPWYAKKCRTNSEKPYAISFDLSADSAVTILPYFKAQMTVAPLQKPIIDTNNAVYYPLFAKKGWEQVWMEDTITLGRKYDYILEKGLAGTAVWALGYTDRSPEMWRLLAAKFGSKTPPPGENKKDEKKDEEKKDTSEVVPGMTDADTQLHAIVVPPPEPLAGSKPAVEYPQVVPVRYPEKNYGLVAMFCLIALTGFALIGFIVSLFYESVREVVFSRDYFIYLVTIVMITALLLLLRAFGLIDKNSIVFVAGALAGAGLVTILFRRMKKKRTEEPTP